MLKISVQDEVLTLISNTSVSQGDARRDVALTSYDGYEEEI